MNNKDYLPKLHKEILAIMDEIDRICKDNNLRYYLVAGSLLGAVRHKGFIPWDDDLDIAMPRQDLDVFLSIAPKKLKADYKLEWITTNKNYTYKFAKVCNSRTVFKENPFLKETGIFVDIFPLDLSPSYSSWLEKKKKKIARLNAMIWIKQKKKFEFKKIICYVMSFFYSRQELYRKMHNIAVSVKERGTTHYANFGSQYNLCKQTMPVEWYDKGVYIPFEDRYYRAPTQYLMVLNSIYGDNYMQLPPPEKRRCHYPMKIVFSDGEELLFDKPSHVVTIEEQES